MGTTSGTAGERRFLMYDYLIKNTCEGRVAKQSDISVLFVDLNVCHKILSLQAKTGTSERSC